MIIPIGFCTTHRIGCPQLGKEGKKECSRTIYWRCPAFTRTGTLTIKPEETERFLSETTDALIREYNQGKNI